MSSAVHQESKGGKGKAEQRRAVVAIVGNPNSGKTTVFNGLTGSRQRIGNWPGVTVERKEGSFTPLGLERVMVEPFATGASHTSGSMATGDVQRQPIRIVDLPGIYSLSANSQDEAIARDYLLSGEPDLVINVVDSTNIQRNLFLTLQLIEMGLPVLVVLNMMDLAEKEGISIEVEHLASHLQCPVVGCVGTRSSDVAVLKDRIASAIDGTSSSDLSVSYPKPLEEAITTLLPSVEQFAGDVGAKPRWAAVALLEGDPWIRKQFLSKTEYSEAKLESELQEAKRALGEDLDVAIADAKYGVIHGLSQHVTRTKLTRASLTERLDRIALNRIVALPIFLGVMYLVFWFTMFIGGAFIDFFDILFATVFVDGFGTLLGSIGSPDWLVGLLAGGIGAGLTTVATFVPIIFAMFIALAVLEDSGYMARAAYVMDRFMRSIGLPGRSFVPMMVGFGCTVPAIMATRTLETPRDRFMTNFMSPFMSCGARLPVYALFAVAFFPGRAGGIVFSLYVAGIAVAILTGFLLKKTLFRGTVSHFIMELPPYHAPRLKFVLSQAWHRLSAFVKRAGVTITLIVAVLALLNSIGTDGSFGNEDQADSVLSGIGRAVTPVFEPMGVEEENWPATVGLFTGIFAKEVVVGTLTSLYVQEARVAEDAEFDFFGGVAEAFASVPEALSGALGGLADPLGTGLVSEDAAAVGEEVGAGTDMMDRMRAQFSRAGAYAYM
ncbi:MAG: ferrous iron transport protein B, partial [Spirochaetales bacterium]